MNLSIAVKNVSSKLAIGKDRILLTLIFTFSDIDGVKHSKFSIIPNGYHIDHHTRIVSTN